ncbi:hypothetical protein [Novosphingobium fuchskuhlense]|uniref:hypothetical protein n=1 Tax=Novosphingobium fuchskuhlense TaxID=1117702 RepID=UPI00147045B4|nr:hypothetical protein [Novosphingobium fuchskuhlense]
MAADTPQSAKMLRKQAFRAFSVLKWISCRQQQKRYGCKSLLQLDSAMIARGHSGTDPKVPRRFTQKSAADIRVKIRVGGGCSAARPGYCRSKLRAHPTCMLQHDFPVLR